MHYYFCTPLDIKFLHKGLALYYSCLKHCGDNFTMWVLCLDKYSYEILNRMNLANAVILTVEDLQDIELLNVKNDRKPAEFAWTSKAPLIKHTLSKIPGGEVATY